MGLKETIDSLVSTAIGAVGNLANVVTIVKKGQGTYDPETGVTVPNDTLIPNIKCVMPGFSAEEKDSEIIVLTDKKGLIARADLPAGVEINKNDELHQGSVKWDVRRILSVPGDSLYKLHLRKIR